MTARDNLIALLQSSRPLDPRTLAAHIDAVEREAGAAVRSECAAACHVLAAAAAARHKTATLSGDQPGAEEASTVRAVFLQAKVTIEALAPEYHPSRRRTDRSPTANGEKDDSHEVPTEER